ncbi:clavesin-1-like [Stegodyphus dumicola]|uniref:clavesin-1-like n=1 Tax=Stegodyphus dumicola TaxID=202533 RepID=UPI0015AE7760|nr:clavesin-1-like [Stegodyphus dumicola]
MPLLLKRCLGGQTQNPNESLNALIWKLCPKNSGCGYNIVKTAVNEAVIIYNEVQAGRLHTRNELGYRISDNAVKFTADTDQRRIQSAKIKAEMSTIDAYRERKGAKLVAVTAIEEQFVDSHRKFFERLDWSAVVRRFLQANVIGFLPYRDSKGSALLYLKAERWDPDQISADDAIFGAIVSIFSAIENPVNQVAGIVVIIDLKHLKLQQIIAISSWLILGTQAMQRCCPFMVKEVHIINVPPVFKAAWKLIKPLISDKIRKRIIFHKSIEWKTLHNLISPNILPSELGGFLGHLNNEHWTKDLDLEQLYYKLLKFYLPKKHISL